MTTAPSAPAPLRRRLAAAVVVLGMAMGAGVSCSTDPKDQIVSPDTDDPTDAGTERAEWDLSRPVTPIDLGSRLDDVASAETLGRDGVDAVITLPGGDVVTGRFGLVTAEAGRDGTVATVKLATTQLHDGAWDERIDGFVERFGGDRSAIDAYLATALPAMQAGEVDPGHSFPGDARPGYQPTLQLRPDEGGVVVNWQFDLTSA